jgi:predicted NBD/HSP70 family sugar kinase
VIDARADGVAAVGVDVGATSTRVAAFDDADQVVARRVVATPPRPAALIDMVVALVHEALDGGHAIVGVGIPGRVDTADGSVRSALNLGIDEVLPLGAVLADHLGHPVHVENDVNAGALGAAAALGLAPSASLAYLSIGTGLAAGFVLGGRIHRGATRVAGEVGHLPVRPDGPRCPCGQLGCAELFGSGGAISARWGPSGAAGLWQAAAGGDPRATAVRDDFVDAICSTIRLVALTLDVDLVAIGGGVIQLGDVLLADLRRRLDALAFASPLLAELRLAHRIQLVPPGSPVGELGTVLAARQALVAEAAG